MKIKELKPIRDNSSEWDALERMILNLFRDEIYLPLLKELSVPKKTLTNSISDLVDAIHSGRLMFYRGEFSGKLNATLTKELRKLGAKWSKGAFRIPHGDLPIDVKNAISTSSTRFDRVLERLDARLSKVLPEKVIEKFSATKVFDQALWKTEESFKESIKAVTVAPKLTPEVRNQIAEEYSKSLELPIKDWVQESVEKLRKDIKKKAFEGRRIEDLVSTIQKSYQVSHSKAKFLARQETKLLMTTYKEARYKDAGVRMYKWKTVVGSTKHPVRPMHAALDGKIFRFDDPPVTDEKGNRNNPGQDYNCRCFAIPVVKF